MFAGISGMAQVTSAIDSTNIKIGEEIKYTIQVEADTTDVVVFPEGQTFMPLEVIESYKVDTTFAQAKYRLIKKYGLTQFDSGSYTIPQQRVLINNKQFLTDSVRIEIQDVVVDTTKQRMFDIKPPVAVKNVPFDFIKLLYWLIPILLLIAVGAYIFFRRKKKREAEEKQLPPYEEAIVALKNLDNSQLLKENKSKEYYSHLTEIVKRYLDREVDDAALESTTDELIERLQLHKDAGHFDFDTETIRHLDQILKRADLVKFAKMQQEVGQAQADRNTIEEIINETHEVIPEPSEEELLQNEQHLAAMRKKRKRKKIIWSITGVVGLALLGIVIYGSVKGVEAVKDIFFNNVTKELNEGRWIKSEYGVPAIIIETPEVLVRNEVEIPESAASLVSDMNMFSFGEMKTFYVSVSTIKYKEAQEVDLEAALEGALSFIEKQGGTNMVVKREDFETDKGINGVKGYGEFKLITQNGKTLPIPYNYEVLLFSQQQGLQQVIVVYQSNEKYGEQIKERVINSVELEVSESKK
jgi:cbb3-type cytochrome oxidase subunit 3